MKQQLWVPVTERLPKLELIFSTWASSRIYPVFTLDKAISAGYFNKYLGEETAYWIVGDDGKELTVTHWIDTEGPDALDSTKQSL